MWDFTISNEDLKNETKINAFVLKAKYAEALRLAQSYKSRNKNKVFYHIQEAILIGDQPTADEKRKNRQKKQAAKLLKKFVRQAHRLPEGLRNIFLNEYYWFSEQPKKQYQHGLSRVKASGSYRGYYSSGVGAATYAYILMKQKKVTEARKWATKSEEAWKNYFKSNKKYYNAYCWYALALGLNQKFDQMYDAFERASKLSKQPATYSEFYSFKNKVFDALTRNDSRNIRKYGPMPLFWSVYNENLRQDLLRTTKLRQTGATRKYYSETMKVTNHYPTDPYAFIKRQVLLADGSYNLPEAQEKKCIAKAVQNLKVAAKKFNFTNWKDEVYCKNELYYHSKQFLAQYQLGAQINRNRPSRGYFSMGVGASEMAHEFRSEGKNTKARKWAKISLQSWHRHKLAFGGDLEKNYFYIQAMYLSGQKARARKMIFPILAKGDDFENALYARILKRWGSYS